MPPESTRPAVGLAILGFFLSNVLGSGISYYSAQRLAAGQNAATQQAAERTEALSLIRDVGTSMSDQEYAFGDVIRAVAGGAPDSLGRVYLQQMDDASRKYRGTADLQGAQLCLYFGAGYRDQYVRHLARFGSLKDLLRRAVVSPADRQARAAALVDSFPLANGEGVALLTSLTQAARADSLHPNNAARACQ